MKMNMKKKRQAGFNLVELAIAMGLIAVFIAGIMIWRSNVASANKLNELSQATAYMVSGIQRLYNSNYGAVDITGAVAASGLVKSPLVPSAGAIADDMGSAVTITGATSRFSIAFSAVTADRCKDIAGLFLNSAPMMVVDATTVKNTLTANTAGDPAAMGTACDGGTLPVAVTVTYQ